MRFLMEMLAEFLLLGWDSNTIKKEKCGEWPPVQIEACPLAEQL